MCRPWISTFSGEGAVLRPNWVHTQVLCVGNPDINQIVVDSPSRQTGTLSPQTLQSDRQTMERARAPPNRGLSAAGPNWSTQKSRYSASRRVYTSLRHTISQDCTQERTVHARRLCALKKREWGEFEREPMTTPTKMGRRKHHR